jgi:hypothetical protein
MCTDKKGRTAVIPEYNGCRDSTIAADQTLLVYGKTTS